MRKLFHIIQRIPSSIYLLLLFSVIVKVYTSQSESYYQWSDSSKNKQIISSDGAGYYMYLPQRYIYHTKNFEFFDTLGLKPEYGKIRQGFAKYEDGKYYGKFFTGTSILMTPAFLIANQYARHSKFQSDGYSYPYELALAISALVFCLIGLYLVDRLLQLYEVKTFARLFAIAAFAFGTNLQYYTIVEPTFSHIYSFAVIAGFLYVTRAYALQGKKYQLIVMFALLGLITIIRPVNFLVVLMVPFLFSSLKDFKSQLMILVSKQWILSLLCLLLFIGIVQMQYYMIYSQYGVWKFSGYQNETFSNWKSPEIWNVLFSFQKGLFIYMPLLILSVIGLYFLYRKSKNLFVGWIIFFVIFTYFTASWWQWYFGGSLGMRPYVDFYSLWIVPLAMLFQSVPLLMNIVFIVIVSLLSYHNSIQSLQMVKSIYHFCDMNFERYKKVFHQTDRRFQFIFFREKWEVEDLSSLQLVESLESDGKDWVVSARQKQYHNDVEYLPTITLDGHQLNNKSCMLFEYDVKVNDADGISCVVTNYYKDGNVAAEHLLMLTDNVSHKGVWYNDRLTYRFDKAIDADSLQVGFYYVPGGVTLRSFRVNFYK